MWKHRYVTSNNWEIAKKYSRNTPSQEKVKLTFFDVMKRVKIMIFYYKIWLFIDVKNQNKIILTFLLTFVYS